MRTDWSVLWWCQLLWDSSSISWMWLVGFDLMNYTLHFLTWCTSSNNSQAVFFLCCEFNRYNFVILLGWGSPWEEADGKFCSFKVTLSGRRFCGRQPKRNEKEPWNARWGSKEVDFLYFIPLVVSLFLVLFYGNKKFYKTTTSASYSKRLVFARQEFFSAILNKCIVQQIKFTTEGKTERSPFTV